MDVRTLVSPIGDLPIIMIEELGKYTIVSEWPEDGYKRQYEPSLYNLELHRMLQRNTGWNSFYLLDKKNKQAEAEFHICLEGNQGKSPFRSPYGGIEFSDQLSEEDLHAFGRVILEQLTEKQITIIPAPEAYDPQHFSRELYLWNSLGSQTLS